MLYLTIR